MSTERVFVAPPSEGADVPVIRQVRHDLHLRQLEVAAVTALSPHMIRVTLKGADLAGFASAAPDDHVKIFLPMADGTQQRRDYTPRRYDPKAGTLELDFVDHPGGPAAEWARAARPGAILQIGGPRGSRVIEGPVRHWLLIGDETALPAIGRRVEELSAGQDVTTVVAVPGPEDQQVFATQAHHTAHWVHRPLAQADQAQGVIALLRTLEIPAGTFAWVGAEASVAKAVRRYLLEERGLSLPWIKASGYWVKGQADMAVKDLG